MKSLSKEELLNLFNSKDTDVFKKKGTFLFRNVIPGETILTIISGKLETFKEPGPDEIVVKNFKIGSSAETYAMLKKDFIKRYGPTEKVHQIDGRAWGVAEAKGIVDGFKYYGPSITITATWGEQMICHYGDMIVRPFEDDDINNIYRIEWAEFKQSYLD